MKCEICGHDLIIDWTDYFGEGTCVTCGAPYQMAEPYGAQPNQTYPHINLRDSFKRTFQEYWKEKQTICRLGTFLGARPQLQEERDKFDEWLKEKHPRESRQSKTKKRMALLGTARDSPKRAQDWLNKGVKS